MANETSSTTSNEGVRFRAPSVEDADETSGHRWEPHTPEQDERVAMPPPPARDPADDTSP
jgi:hypothetical protein